jgi:sugar porter (SP) family MFS transporter
MIIAGSQVHDFPAKITFHVIMVALLAASGGLLFGYDNGITGGVTSFLPFLEKFFPAVARATEAGVDANSAYCKYDNQGLQLFTSSLFLAGAFASLVASFTTRSWGRKRSMLIGGLFFCLGAALVAAAQDLAMLIVGRICLGIGVGFANQAVPLYLSEMAPARIRGALNIMFQLAVTIGILVAQLINYGTQYIDPWGWRLSLGLAGVPALLITLGGLILPETPNSLVERGHVDRARVVLRKVRGVDDVELELQDIVSACEMAARVKHPWRNIIKPRYRPQLVFCIVLEFFQQFTGINAIIFYAPVLFNSLGSGKTASLLSVIIGVVNVLSTLVAVFTVDKFGRRALLLEAGVQMFLAQVATAITLGVQFHQHPDGNLSSGISIIVIVIICIFISSFAWSWGPLGWLIPSEIQPIETRSAGQSITVFTNLIFTFVIGQSFLSMLCAMQFGIFLFFAGWVVIMSLFVLFFLPETKGVPLEDMPAVFRRHWFWGRFSPPVESIETSKDTAEALPEVNGKGAYNGTGRAQAVEMSRADEDKGARF